MDDYEKMLLTIFLHQLMWQDSFFFVILLTYFFFGEEAFELRGDKPRISYSLIKRMPDQKMHLHNLIETSDVVCVNILRMDRLCFRTLYMLVTPQSVENDSEDRSWKYFKIRGILTVWKKEYYIVLNMINTSGLDWNDSSNQISVSDDVWEEYVKTHSAVKDFREKSYRYFHDWVEIFGKDRATGKNSQGPEDLEKVAKEVPPANEELYVPHFDATIFNINQNEDPYIRVSHFDENIGNDFPYDSVPIDEEITDTPSPGECNSSININKRAGGKKMESSSSKKRSRLETNSKEPTIVNLMDQFFKQQNESIGIFVDKLGMNKQPEEVDKTKLVLEALSKMGTLTEENKLYFAYKIATDATVMNLFLNFSKGERITFVNVMTAGKI
ncbi:hypothetical protein OROGR_019418 [Orobanche gracilis]